jgi:hypothetical protein
MSLIFLAWSVIMWVSSSLCSIVPEIPFQKPFCIFVFIYSFCTKYEYIRFRIIDVKTFAKTGCKVIGRKLDGSFALSFLWMSIVKACFHDLGSNPLSQQCDIIRWRAVRSIGQFFNTKILIWSKEHADDPDFIFLMILEISEYVGAVISKE